ncbi:Alpha/Beta hydrolase protein [Thamnocephalis sphaerospora]|uniref:Alpha/Beta hydrolase protein n=1 Tax=Thamnocephalis sphaerospora TaxID=78915 RepID=A0A4P9XM11_9FUNG|nr:Alpha/Beta hydrolase protein [Thamnocephalis sphaerospora]|eukprot:RKP06933.1 Alpha/Beta hydrolase protein [Thamnocephalis sphaerospora]
MRFLSTVAVVATAVLAVVSDITHAQATAGTFDKLTGDVVVIHGWGGSKLVDTTKNNEVYWLTEEVVNNQVHPPMHLPINNRDDDYHPVKNSGYLESSSFLAYYTPFLNAIQQAAQASAGRFRVHLFDYDFRRDNVDTTQKFVAYLNNIYNGNGKKKMSVISHSMGGVITMAAIHQAPHLIGSVVMAGPPFNGSITALHDKLEGAPVGTNTEVFSADTHFLLRSSFCFFPFDGTGLVRADGSELIIDYFNPINWWVHKLAAPLKSTATSAIGTYQERVAYMIYAVSKAALIKFQMYARPFFPYPKIAILAGNQIPTVYRYPATFAADGSLNVNYANAINVPGDGLISLQSVRPPTGIPHTIFYTANDHMTLLNDLTAVGQAINSVA